MTMPSRRDSLSRMARSSRIFSASRASSSRIFSRSSPVRPLKLHVQDGLGLDLRERETLDEAFARLRRVAGGPDQGDDGVQVVERDLEPLQDVDARLGLGQVVLGAAPDHFPPELEELLHQVEQRQDLRAALHDRQRDDPERGLQRRVLVEVVQHHLRHLAAAQLDHDAHAAAVGLVAQIGDSLDYLLAHEVGNLLEEPGLVDLVRDLVDDDGDPLALLPGILDLGARPHRDRTPAGQVGLDDAGPSDDEPAGGEVRARESG